MLFIGRSKITDEGLAHLRGLKHLQKLFLGDNQVTEAGLAHLEGLADLQQIWLDLTWTNAEVVKIQNALPNCELFPVRLRRRPTGPTKHPAARKD